MVNNTLYDRLMGIKSIVGILEKQSVGRGKATKRLTHTDIVEVYNQNGITAASATINVYFSMFTRLSRDALADIEIGCGDEHLWGANGPLFSRSNMYTSGTKCSIWVKLNSRYLIMLEFYRVLEGKP